MIDETITRLFRAVSSDADDAAETSAARSIIDRFVACLPLGLKLKFERRLLSLAQAAEELPNDATPLEIDARAAEIRRRAH